MDNAGPQAGPPLVVNIQFVKDLSFEVPGAPEIFSTLRSQPNVSHQPRRAGPPHPGRAERVRGGAGGEGRGDGGPAAGRADRGRARPRVFIAELSYAGIFTLNGIPEQSIEPVLLIECPRLLFPYARNILADVTRDGGFPPVLLQPIDFVALWQARKQTGAQTTANV